MKQTLFGDLSQRDQLQMGSARVPLNAAAMRLIGSTYKEFSIVLETRFRQLYEMCGGQTLADNTAKETETMTDGQRKRDQKSSNANR